MNQVEITKYSCKIKARINSLLLFICDVIIDGGGSISYVLCNLMSLMQLLGQKAEWPHKQLWEQQF